MIKVRIGWAESSLVSCLVSPRVRHRETARLIRPMRTMRRDMRQPKGDELSDDRFAQGGSLASRKRCPGAPLRFISSSSR